jgi:hypothetical protein
MYHLLPLLEVLRLTSKIAVELSELQVRSSLVNGVIDMDSPQDANGPIKGVNITGADLNIAGDIVGRDKVINIYNLVSAAVTRGDQNAYELLAVGKELLARKTASVYCLDVFRTDAEKLLQRIAQRGIAKIGNAEIAGLEKPNSGSSFVDWAEYERSIIALICDALGSK